MILLYSNLLLVRLFVCSLVRDSSIEAAGNRLESVERLDDSELGNVCRRKRSWPIARRSPIILFAGLKKITRLLVQRSWDVPYNNQEGYQHKGKVQDRSKVST